MSRELEVKILGIEPEEMEKKIIALGGKLLSKEKQTNILIDSESRPIKSFLDAYLRIRHTEDLISGNKFSEITLKKNLRNDVLRENVELNVTIDDSNTMLRILRELGFDKVTVGFKDRASYSLYGARLDIDVWDKETYPNPYMEIEVDNEEKLAEILGTLHIKPESVSRLSIVELQRKLREGTDAK
ncbi:class IV adenylate cyclase [Gudongella oleilytica]|uniref:class IV adenylate cyclase n=1 Tax=Gudongella oleilytica TaxID=1582259 RepID=UPI002A35FF25|nr:class IV adenylate cyclase [Gudongella oleilytica]MDY0257464.1 class IV adenylate cyclase [Gudongella oleilytica]